MVKQHLLLLMILLLGAVACDGQAPSDSPAPSNGSEPLPPLAAGAVRVAIDVAYSDTRGTITVDLYPDKAPNTVKNFLWHVANGTYTGSSFHRIIKGFMIQGGKPADPTKTFTPIAGEFGGMKHLRGVISMARTNDVNSATSQFFIMHQNTPHLDGKYASFGEVVAEIGLVDKIATLPTHQSVPVVAVMIEKITVVEDNRNQKEAINE